MTSREDSDASSLAAVGMWLDGLGLGRFRPIFEAQEIDVEALQDLTDPVLEAWGIPFGPRRRLLRAIAARTDRSATTPPSSFDGTAPQLAADSLPGPGRPGAERRQVTALFCDMVGSSALASRLDPEDMGALITTYQQICRTAIEHFGGYGVTYFGDGVFGCFGWPKAHENDAERAVRAGLAILQAAKATPMLPGLVVPVRVGIATGLVVIGDLSGGARPGGLSIVGETPNLAARLQGIAEPNTLIISDRTRRLLGGLFELRRHGTMPLKGFDVPVDIWEVTGEAQVDSRFAAARGQPVGQQGRRLLGREVELAALQEAWELTLSGRGQAVLLAGEPGIGKSRLVEAFSAAVREMPHLRLRYQCSAFQMNTPLHPVIRQIERGAAITSADDAATRLSKLSTLANAEQIPPEMLPLLADMVAGGIDGAVQVPEPQSGLQQTLEKLADLLIARARQTPLLVLVEDAQWIDPTTRELLSRLSGQLAEHRLMVLMTIRSDAAASWTATPEARRLDLARLDRRTARELVALHGAGAGLAEEVRELILEKTDGVPLFIEELTRAAVEARGDGVVAAAEVPTTLQDSLMARLDRLSGIKTVAQLCAVVGRESSFRLLQTLVEAEATDLPHALQTLVQAGILVEAGQGRETVFRFRHALMQDAAAASMLRAHRQALHARIGAVLRDRFPEAAAQNPELVAHHFTEAQQTEEAVRWWHRAGRVAIRRSADAEATNHLRRGLDLLAILPAGDERDRLEIALRADLAGPLFGVQGFTSTEAEANAERGWQLCKHLGAHDLAFTVLWARGQVASTRGDVVNASAYAEQMLRMAEALADDRRRALALRNLGIAHQARGDQPAAREALEHALELLSAQPEDEARANAYAYGLDPLSTSRAALALTLQQIGDQAEAEAQIRAAEAEARESDHLLTLAYVLFRIGVYHMVDGNVSEAGQVSEELVAMGRRYRLASWTRLGESVAGWHQARTGMAREGLALMRASIDGQRERGSFLWQPLMMCLEAALLTEQGDTAGALSRLATAEKDAERLSHTFGMAELHRVRASALRRQGAPLSVVQAALAAGARLAAAQGAGLGAKRLGEMAKAAAAAAHAGTAGGGIAPAG